MHTFANWVFGLWNLPFLFFYIILIEYVFLLSLWLVYVFCTWNTILFPSFVASLLSIIGYLNSLDWLKKDYINLHILEKRLSDLNGGRVDKESVMIWGGSLNELSIALWIGACKNAELSTKLWFFQLSGLLCGSLCEGIKCTSHKDVWKGDGSELFISSYTFPTKQLSSCKLFKVCMSFMMWL